MTRWPALFLAAWLPACTAATTTEDTDTEPVEVPAGLEVCAEGPFSADLAHPFLPFAVGTTLVLEGLEGGTDYAKFDLEVLDETEVVGDVETRVVLQHNYVEGDVLVETSRVFFAVAPDGTVCLFGEEIEEPGSAEVDRWAAGEDGAFAAIAMPADPQVGASFIMYFVPDDEEHPVEYAEVTALGEEVVTPAGTFADTVTILEDGPSIKRYAREVGPVYDDGIELTSY